MKEQASATKKIKSDLKKMTCTQAALAEALELTRARVNQLIDEEVVIPDEEDKARGVFIFDSLRNYFLSNKVSDSGVNYWKEKGLHEAAKRKTAELKLREMEGELYEASTVENAFAEILGNLRNNLLGLPAKYAIMLENQPREKIYSILTREIEEQLEVVSQSKGEKFFPQSKIDKDS